MRSISSSVTFFLTSRGLPPPMARCFHGIEEDFHALFHAPGLRHGPFPLRLGLRQIHFAEDPADLARHQVHRFGKLLAGLRLLLNKHRVLDRQQLPFEHLLHGCGFLQRTADELILPIVADLAGVLGVLDEVLGELLLLADRLARSIASPGGFSSRARCGARLCF